MNTMRWEEVLRGRTTKRVLLQAGYREERKQKENRLEPPKTSGLSVTSARSAAQLRICQLLLAQTVSEFPETLPSVEPCRSGREKCLWTWRYAAIGRGEGGEQEGSRDGI